MTMSDESSTTNQNRNDDLAPNQLPNSSYDIGEDRIHVILPDRSQFIVAMKLDGLFIGRSPGNDISLNQSGISRRHALIEFDGTNYLVRDLKSTNGTFLGSEKIDPDNPQVWLPGDEISIGETRLVLERAGQGETTTAVVSDRQLDSSPPATQSPTLASPTASTTPSPTVTPPTSQPVILTQTIARSDGTTIDDSQLIYNPARTLAIYCETPNISVAPGKPTSISLLIANRGQSSENFRVSIDGIPKTWVVNPPPAINIAAGSQRELQITFQPPRASESRAGRHSVTLRVSGQANPSQFVEARLALSVAAFSQFVSELLQRQIRSGDIARLEIHNQGNVSETFSVIFDDKQNDLVFDPSQAQITIPAGQSAAVEFRVGLISPRLFGPELSHPFSAVVTARSGQYQPHSAEMLSLGMIPPWAPVALIVLCVLVSCVGVILLNTITAPQRAQQRTSTAEVLAVTQIAQATQQAQMQGTLSVEQAMIATSSAATATANWFNLDLDGDGLTNAQELALGTKYDVADTDGDGLSDGDEVNLYKTNPLLQDTDGDGLSDGEEVRLGTDPLNPDTDGDGIPDGIDPDPLTPSTPTPTFIFTNTPTHTTTPTVSPTTQTPTADLTITMSNGTNTSVSGKTTTYTIIVTNKGPSAVSNIQVTNTFPGILLNITWVCSASGGSNCQTPNGSGNINHLVNLAVNGQATFVISATIHPDATGLLVNTASATLPAGVNEVNPADNLAIDTDNLIQQAALTLAITDNKNTISPGDPTAYTIVATNNGPSTVSGLTVTSNFPASLSNMTWSCTATAGSACAPAGVQPGNVNVNATLRPGASVTVTANGLISKSAVGNINVTANLSSPVDPAVNNKSASDLTTIIPKSDLSISVDAPDSASANTPITYTITITNSGPSVATGIVLTQTLPAEVSFIASAPGAPTCSLEAGNNLVCNLGNLAAGETLEIKVIVKTPLAPGTISVIFEVRLNELDPDPVNNTFTKETLIL
jgi:uncharacterized repeat protein (TIGR01451 family)